MGILFGSPEAIAILEADKKEEEKHKICKLMGKIYLANNNNLRPLQKYVGAREALEKFTGRVEDAQCDLQDATRKAEEEAADLPENERDQFVEKQLEGSNEKEFFDEAEGEREQAEAELNKAIGKLILPYGTLLDDLSDLTSLSMLAWENLNPAARQEIKEEAALDKDGIKYEKCYGIVVDYY